MAIWLGLDCGGTFLKATLYDETGRAHGTARSGLPVLSRRPGWAERDMDDLWRATCSVIRAAIASSDVTAADIRGIGISAQGKGLFLLDRQLRPLGAAALSADRRALDQVRRWQAEGIPAELYPTTLQTLWTGHPVSLLRWFKDEEPETYRDIGAILMGHDYLRFRLTGALGCEITNISESNLYAMREGHYDPALATMLGIDEVMERLPPVVGSAEVVGTVTATAAAETGLAIGTPVVGGLFDVVSTCLCAGIEDESRLNAVMGTWSVTTGVTDRIADGQALPFVYGRHAEPGLFIVHDASPTSAANLEWVAHQLGDLDYAAVNAGIAALAKAGTDLQFLPFLYGSNAGLGMTGGFYGLQALHGRDHLLQAAYEGVVFSHLHHLDRMRLRFPAVEALRVTGGPTRSDVWMQILADASGLIVEVPEIEETGCLGAALAAAVGTGGFADFWAAMRAVDPEVKTIRPDLSVRERYGDKLVAYRELIRALNGFEDTMTSIRAARAAPQGEPA